MVSRILLVVAASALVGASTARADDAAATEAMHQAMEEQAPVISASDALPEVKEADGQNNQHGINQQGEVQENHEDQGQSGDSQAEVADHGELGENAGTAGLGEQNAAEHGATGGQSGSKEDGSH
jgi:riboflavin biosynthesis pyrimidine reductase